MRALLLAAALWLSGCAGTWFPAAIVDHMSSPSEGWPANDRCDPTEEFAGGAAGYEFPNGNTKVYAALGAKRMTQCGAPTSTGSGFKALLIHEFRGQR